MLVRWRVTSGSSLTLTLKLLWHGGADYDFTDSNTSAEKTLADYKEMEELSETFGPGRKHCGID